MIFAVLIIAIIVLAFNIPDRGNDNDYWSI